MISLVDLQGKEVGRTLTTGSGTFLLTVPGPGRYRLRADRIGYVSSSSDPFDVAAFETVRVDILASMEVIALRGIEVVGDRRCQVRPEEGLEVTTVWNEARKALVAAAWTQGRGYYYYEMMGIRRRLDRDGLKLVSQDRSRNMSYMQAPYVSRPADSLVTEGFASITPWASIYWAPDADVLLSDPFLDTHCLRLKTDMIHAPGLIGLAFEPVAWRPVADIGGTLWLDPETGGLVRLDYTYRHLDLPETLLAAEPGGTVVFEAMPNGAWIVKSWRIRMPVADTRTSLITGQGMTRLEGIEVQGGDVIRAHDNRGPILAGGPTGSIAGVVLDSLGGGLRGARVFVEGTGIQSSTDREGRFELAQLDAGIYPVTFNHPYLERFDYVPEPVEVKVVTDASTPAEIGFAAPTISGIVEGKCRAAERPEPVAIRGTTFHMDGVLRGRLTDLAGSPVPNAAVRIRWAWFHGNEVMHRAYLEAVRRTTVVTSNEAGYYLACWVPINTLLGVAVVEAHDQTETLDSYNPRPRTWEQWGSLPRRLPWQGWTYRSTPIAAT